MLAGLGAVLLLVATFFTWFGDLNAWEAFEVLDLVLALLALAVVAALLGAGDGFGPRFVAPLGALALLIVVVQLAEPPPAVLDADRGAGVWLGLGAALAILLGGALRTSRVSVTVNVGERETRARVPSVDRRTDTAPATAPTRPITEDRPTEAFSPLDPPDDHPASDRQ